ncbi:MAG: efflux transporter outer membrane subunit [Deltaproteobacteria bacterium]|nr:efflux transporter outer membrane subunit [Deltaproteobacteria bacterium]
MKRIFLSGLCLAVLVAACAKPEPHDPLARVPEIPPRFMEAPRGETADVPDPWWEEFGQPELNGLVQEVIANNLDIARAAALADQAAFRLSQAGADRWPSVSLRAEAARQSGGQLPITEWYSVSVPAVFEVDLWGRLSKLSGAARESLLAARENRRAVLQSVVAEAVSAWIEARGQALRLSVAQKSVDAYQENLDLVRRRYASGLASALDLTRARRALAGAKARLPSIETGLQGAQKRLAVLAGRYPAGSPAPTDPALSPWMPDPKPVPPGLPSELLEARPDIRAARARLAAADLQAAAAWAARFPSISLTGSLGYASPELSSLTDEDSEQWSLDASLLAPLFDAGKRKARQKEAEAAASTLAIEYAKTVLTAFTEVETALVAQRLIAQRQKEIETLVAEAKAGRDLAVSRYERGLADYLAVLEAEQAYLDARLQEVEVRQAGLQNRVTLHRVLGGAWVEKDKQDDKEFLKKKDDS